MFDIMLANRRSIFIGLKALFRIFLDFFYMYFQWLCPSFGIFVDRLHFKDSQEQLYCFQPHTNNSYCLTGMSLNDNGHVILEGCLMWPSLICHSPYRTTEISPENNLISEDIMWFHFVRLNAYIMSRVITAQYFLDAPVPSMTLFAILTVRLMASAVDLDFLKPYYLFDSPSSTSTVVNQPLQGIFRNRFSVGPPPRICSFFVG